MPQNSAFVFIKPHAVTDPVKELVRRKLQGKGIEIKSEGLLTGKEISERMLIDQHYYAIACKATLLKPHELNVPKDKFKEKFGLEWDEALKTGNVLNAKDACERLKMNAAEFETAWRKAEKAEGPGMGMVKFGGGFYCARMDVGDHKLYVFNGFFMAMRHKFVADGATLHYFVVEWDPSALSWEDFRGKLLGPTDPEKAPVDSLRGAILKDWESLGLKGRPTTSDNAMHASASPFEGLAEKMNWLSCRIEDDAFGKLALDAGISAKTLQEWSKDPQVKWGSPDAKPRSVFDALEDADSDACIDIMKEINAGQNPAKKARI